MMENQSSSAPLPCLENGMDIGHGPEARTLHPRISWPTRHPKRVPAAWGRLIDTRSGLES